MNTSIRTLMAGSALASLLGAQEPAATQIPQPEDGGLLAPIHTAPEGEEELGPYGLWAAGDDWKASFHDGFSFYPVLGREAPRNLPLRWRSTSWGPAGSVDPHRPSESLVEERWTATRFERSFGGQVVEAYDLSAEGVEQTFTLNTPFRGGQDLEIAGALVSPLSAAVRPASHGELVRL